MIRKVGGMPGTRLRAQGLWSACGWALVGAVVLLSLWPTPLPDPGNGESDKGLHVLAYAVLMVWFASIYDELGRRRRIAAAFVAMGIALELLQPLTGLRKFEWIDFFANTAGVLVGWALAPPRLPNALRCIERVFASEKS